MRTTFLLIMALLCQANMFAQYKFDESAMKQVLALIMNKEHNKADSILNHYQRYPQETDASFLLDLTRCQNGYIKVQTVQDVSVIIPYSEAGKRAFTYIKNNINKGNASLSDLWPFLISYAEIFNYMKDSIISDISSFSVKYYNEFGVKNLYSYFTVLLNTYQYHFSKREWQSAIDAMKSYRKAAIEANDSTIRVPMSSAFIGAAYLRNQNNQEALKWLTDSYNCFQNFCERFQSTAYCEMLNDLAFTYYLENNNGMAYKYAIMSCETIFSKYGRFSTNYLNALDTRNNCEIKLDKTKEALEHIGEFLSTLDSITDMTIEEKYNCIIKSATYSASDKKAIILFEHLLECFNKNTQNTDLNYYAFVVSSLADLYISEGHYIKADSILNNAFGMIDNNNVMSKEIVGLYHSKGNLYYSLSNIEKALQLLMKAKSYYDSVCTKDINYAKLLSNLSMCYFEKNDFLLAKSFADEAYTLYTDSYGSDFEEASGTLLLLNNLALIYASSKEYDKAKMLYERIIVMSSKTHDKEMKSLAQLGLAQLFLLEGNYSNANKIISKINVNELRMRDKDVFDFLSSLLSCLQSDDNIDFLVNRYNTLQKAKIADVFKNFSEIEREEYWTLYSRLLVLLNNLAAIKSGTSQAIVMAYNNTLYTKNMLINSGRLLGELTKNCSSDIQNEYFSMTSMKRKLSDKNSSKDSLDVYREAISQKEKAIIASIPDFEDKLKVQFKTCDDVRKMLTDKDIAIEFIFLPQIKSPFEDSELAYGAMLLTNSDKVPKLIPLCSEYDLENLMDAYSSIGQNEIDSLYASSNKMLYHMIWEKIEPYIPVGSSVYYAPTGYISKINLSAISNGNKRLSEVYDFHEVSTTALIDEVKQSAQIDCLNAALYGNINYYEDIDMMTEKAKTYSMYTSGEVLATRSLNRGTWDLLPGTKEEVETIAEMLRGKGINVYMLTQNDANEESFKGFDAHAPELMHIATHGFYFSPKEDVTPSFFNSLHSYTKKDYSMLYSGLLFAGGNNAWAGKEIEEGVEDGILTADEISRLDLSANKLIVLSACNTGLGDIDNVDGAFGLQRGLKRAGAKTVLMSLWKVPDKETIDLMRMFYKELLNGNTPQQSLKSSQKQMMAEGKTPYYWAGFILLD